MDAHEDRRHRTVRTSVLLVVGMALIGVGFIAQEWRSGDLIGRAASAAADSTAARMHAQIVERFGARIDSLGVKVDSLGPRVDSLWKVMIEERASREP